jgi:hypothetical protein
MGKRKNGKEFDISFDIAMILEEDMTCLDKFMSPKGRFMLAFDKDQPVGIACL